MTRIIAKVAVVRQWLKTKGMKMKTIKIGAAIAAEMALGGVIAACAAFDDAVLMGVFNAIKGAL